MLHYQPKVDLETRRIVGDYVRLIRTMRPDVVLTFGPDGAYGHPDHIAISQLTAAAAVKAADRDFDAPGAAHAVSKLYFIAWPASAWAAYQTALKRLVSVVDGVERQAVPWPDWSVTTVIDTRLAWQAAWRAVSCVCRVFVMPVAWRVWVRKTRMRTLSSRRKTC